MVEASVIIACKGGSDYLEQCLKACASQQPRPEIIVLPDGPYQSPVPDVRVIPTGDVSPAHKRDLGAEDAQAEILAFLDDDAYPAPGWLAAAMKGFVEPSVSAVGGPGVTPPEDDLRKQAGGAVYASICGSGGQRYRYVPMPGREVDDFPTCNLFVRKKDFLAVGGFDTHFWPGEDTKLCLDLVYQLKKKILYTPDALVYHHRRALFLPHLRQVARYGRHRGYFVKRFPQTSFRASYFAPTAWLAFLIGGPLPSILIPLCAMAYGAIVLAYLACVIAGCWSASKRWSVCSLAALGTVATHITYGLNFAIGLCSKRLKEETQP